jgi:nitrate/nitrite transport system permease protein
MSIVEDSIGQSLTGAPPMPVVPSPASVAIEISAPVAVARAKNVRLTGMLSTVGWALVGFAVFVAVWHLGATHVKDLPLPSQTLTRLRTLLSHAFTNKGPNDKGVGLLLQASLTRVFSGFLIAAIVGIPLGLAMGSSPHVWKALNPLSQLLRPVSPLAWYPILLVIFVNAGKASVWVICMTSLWPIVLNTAAGASTVPKDQRNVAKVFHLPMRSYVRHVLIPHTLGPTITGLRLSMGTAWMVIVAVEMMSGKTGIGNYVWNQYNAGDMAAVTASIVLIGATGLILDFLFLRLGKAVTRQEAHA